MKPGESGTAAVAGSNNRFHRFLPAISTPYRVLLIAGAGQDD